MSELTREQLEMKVGILTMTLGVIAKNERSCPDIETARQMAARAMDMVDEHVTREPRDIFEAYGFDDDTHVIDGSPEGTTVGALRKEFG